MSNWRGRVGLPYDSEEEDKKKQHNKKLAEERTKAERDAALNKAYNHYENTKIHHTKNIIKIRAAARALIVALKAYKGISGNAGTINAINGIIKDELNKIFLKNLNSNAKGLAAAEATRKKHNNNLNYAMYTS